AGALHNMAGYALVGLGKIDFGESRLAPAHQAHAAAGSRFGFSYVEVFCALMGLGRGGLGAAAGRFPGLGRTSTVTQTYITAVSDAVHGIIAHFQGRLAHAEKLLGRALPRLFEVGQTNLIVRACSAFAHLRVADGSHEAAERVLAEAQMFCSR